MAELLHSTHGYDVAEEAEDADLILLNTCSTPRKSAGKGFSPVRSLEKPEKEQSEFIDWCWWLRCFRKAMKYAPARLLSILSLALKPCTACRKWLIRSARLMRLWLTSLFLKLKRFDRLAEPKADGAKCFCLYYGRLQQILLILCCALHSW